MSNQIIESILNSIKIVIGEPKKFIPLHEPTFHGNEWDYIKECLDTGWVSSVGSYVDRFEKDLETFTGVKHAVAVVNGTAGLHASLVVLGIERNDEVLIPTLTFVATANAVSYCGAIPHFVDSEMETMGVDPVKLDNYLSDLVVIENGQSINRKTGRRIKALIPMHVFGHPVKIKEISKICEKYHLALIEDAAESLGSYVENRHTGNFGKVSVVSFNGNKIITTGGGGAILTNDSEIAKRLTHITKTSKVPHSWEFIHDEVGFNYRLPNLNSALGCAQLEELPNFLKSKRELAQAYNQAFKNNEFVRLFTEVDGYKSNYWLNAIILNDEYISERDNILRALNENNIMARPIWRLLNKLEPYKDCPKMSSLECAEKLEASVINIPSSPYLRESSGN